jgi:bifunctional non-homologous end joining protein LigD
VSLRDYQSKRRFSQTPEPEGKVQEDSGPLRFVVQKHQARRLHHDLRLELGGTLKSWAVPKGPSLNPEDKRLAIMVEDHPLDYATFEGTIPAGNYGAGTVMVWDEGTYHVPGIAGRAENERLLQEALAAGNVKLFLEGKKLRGEFALVKLKRGEENAWLLIKKQDDFATDRPRLEEDRSVLSHRTMAEITSGRSPPNDSSALDLSDAPRSAMPRNIKPMLASPVDKAFDHPDWLFEIKWDGFRAIAEVEQKGIRLYSRKNLSLAERFPSVVQTLRGLGHEAVLDGEIVALDATGKAQFQLLQNYQTAKKGVLAYYVFDLLYLDGHDLCNLPLVRRKELLARIIEGLPGVSLSEHITEHGRAFFEAVAGRQLEGVVAKLAKSRYLPGQRGQTWLKLKTHMRQEAVIGGFTEERSNPRNLGALVLGVYEGDDLIYIGCAGSGFTRETQADVHARLKPLVQKACAFKTKPKPPTTTHWVRPELVCEVSFAAWTDDGHIKHPVFVGLRDDLTPRSIHREASEDVRIALKEAQEEASSRAPAEALPPPSSADGLTIDGHPVRLTNQDKVYWPAERYTKGDLIAYYRDVANVLLPHLRDRPQSLNRHPNGISGKSFFQKDVAKQPPPDWVQTVDIPSDEDQKVTRTVLCQDEASLVYLANLGCIELNPWHARVGSLELADYMVLDLDPEGVAMAQIAEVAQAIRKLLERLDVACYCKTSGKRGLHVYVPFGARYGHEQAKQFAYLIAQIIHRQFPGVTSLARDPRQRQQRLYLDFLQNGKGKTLAAPYSARPHPGATVSTPLKWSEVNKRLDPAKFTIRTLPRRLERVGDLWAPVLGPGIDLTACLERLPTVLQKS